jgi:hypothetical protein
VGLVCWIRTYVVWILILSAVFKYILGEGGIAVGSVDLKWVTLIPMNRPADSGGIVALLKYWRG